MTTTMTAVTTTELPAPADADPEWVCIFFVSTEREICCFVKKKLASGGKNNYTE